MADDRDRRQHRRIDSRFAIRLGGEKSLGEHVATSGMNISMGGVYCEVPYYVPVMTKLEATLVLPVAGGGEEVLETEMIVVWSEPEAEIPDCDSYQIGCAFLPMSDERKDLLRRYVDLMARVTAGDAVQ